MSVNDKKPLGEQNYEQFAQRYAERVANKPHNALYDVPATTSLLPPDMTGLQALDAGCGSGIYSEWMLKHGAKVTAFDVTPDMVRITRERLKTYDRLDAVHQADLDAPLTFADDDSFDVVVCALVIHYVHQPETAYRECFRVLKSGGMLVISSVHPFFDWLYWRKRNPEVNYFEREMTAIPWGGFGEPRPVIRSYRMSLSEMLNPILDAGFRLDHVLEPRPLPEFKDHDPEGYEELMRFPGFICLRAIKP